MAVVTTDDSLRFPAIECNPRFNGASYPTLIAGKLGTPFCFGDGTSLGCPCGNTGAAGAGCAFSAACWASIASRRLRHGPSGCR